MDVVPLTTHTPVRPPVVQDGAYRNGDFRLPFRVLDFDGHRRAERGRRCCAIKNVARLVGACLGIGGVGNLSQTSFSAETVATVDIGLGFGPYVGPQRLRQPHNGFTRPRLRELNDCLASSHDLSGISESIDDRSIRICKKNGIGGRVFRDLGVGFSRGKLCRGRVESRLCLFVTLLSGSQSIFHQRRIAFLICLCLGQDGTRCGNRIAPSLLARAGDRFHQCASGPGLVSPAGPHPPSAWTIFPGTRKPRLLCTREETVPVNERSAASAFVASATITSGEAVRGSAASASCFGDSKTRKKATAPAAATRPTKVRTCLRFILGSLLDQRSG